MNDDRARLIRELWALVAPRADEVATAFYTHLFELEPEARVMFANVDMPAQRRKFMDMIGAMVRLLDDPADIIVATTPAARRHVQYGVTDRHLDAGSEALLAALQDTLGDRFTRPARQAWRELYELAAAVMRRAAARADASAPAG